MFHNNFAVVAFFFSLVTRLFVFDMISPLELDIASTEPTRKHSKLTFVIRMVLNERRKLLIMHKVLCEKEYIRQ